MRYDSGRVRVYGFNYTVSARRGGLDIRYPPIEGDDRPRGRAKDNQVWAKDKAGAEVQMKQIFK